MDIPALKAELEQHLTRNPHPDAPEGFRDRFEQAVEHYQAATDAENKSDLEAQLKRIVDEADAAGDAAGPAARLLGKSRLRVLLGAVGAAAAAIFYFRSRR